MVIENKINNSLGKVLLFTHTDLDGYGSVVLLTAIAANFKYEACNYDNINDVIDSYITSGKILDYDTVIITDISVNETIAKKLEHLNVSYIDIMLMDHHETAEWLNEYNWALVMSKNEDGELLSGTYLFNQLLKSLNDGVSASYLYDSFAENVRDYDTWLWTKNDNKTAKHLNDLFYIIGPEEFVLNMSRKISYELPLLDSDDILLLNSEKKRIDRYYKEVMDNSYELSIDVKVGEDIVKVNSIICFAEQYHSEIGNRFCEDTGKDLAVLINLQKKKVSYRSIGNKIHLGNDIAKPLGGGGHMNSAGSQIDIESIKNIIGTIFDEQK